MHPLKSDVRRTATPLCPPDDSRRGDAQPWPTHRAPSEEGWAPGHDTMPLSRSYGGAGCCGLSGSRTVKHAPPPATFRAAIAPPCASAIWSADVEAEAQATVVPRGYGALEALEDPRQIGFGDARPPIANFDDSHVIRPRRRHCDRLSRCVLDRVRDQVRQHLLNPEPIPVTFDRTGRIHREGATGGRCLIPQAFDGLPDDLDQIEAFDIEPQLTGGDARHVEQRLDQARQTVTDPFRAIDLLRQLRRSRGVGRAMPCELQLQRGERRLQLVRGDREEFVPESDRPPGPAPAASVPLPAFELRSGHA